jgi:hypothetical protein
MCCICKKMKLFIAFYVAYFYIEFIAFYVVYFYIEDTVSITETARIAQLCD